jgi:glycosyltransferase involved in cell wall biosynthesis
VAALTFRVPRSAWLARFHTSRLAQRAQTKTLAKRLRANRQEFDLALQVLGWVRGQPQPLVIYVDQTRLMAERGWPAWMPLAPRERDEVLALEHDMYNQAFHLFVMGRSASDSLVAEYGVDPSRVTVVGGGANFEPLPEAEAPSPDPTILFVGRDFRRKGGDCLIEAFRRLRSKVPEATLNIVGVSEHFGVPGVVSHGQISSRRDLADLYRETRVFCLPSRYEPWGLALVEAMAHGIPCVGTTVQSIPHILGNGQSGLLVPPNDPDQLANAALELLTDDELAGRLGAAGRRRVEQVFTWERVVERMAPVLERFTPIEK